MLKEKLLVDKLETTHRLNKEEWVCLIENGEKIKEYIFEKARKIADNFYGKKVFIRGLIEFTNYCRNDCLYCGIRRSNEKVNRYRLTEDEIFECCKEGYELGFRTFVLQGGEDMYFTDEMMVKIISGIKEKYPDCALTLSVGERNKETYEKYYRAGADRFLLRHETANECHYAKLHPEKLTLKNRMKCLYDLKDIGFQTGCGMMIGSPYQTSENLAEDMIFLSEFKPHMVGMGPFVSHKDTPFADFENGSSNKTILMLGLTRIMLPEVLLPATTALGTVDGSGREKAVLAGANVVMPNLSPLSVRKKYMLYDNKISTGDEAAESLNSLKARMKKIGYEISHERGDYKDFKRK